MIRFEDFVEPEPMSGCWLWMGCARPSGYGWFSRSLPSKREAAHRSSWLLYKGDIPNGMDVLHKCDMPMCVNPAHLFLGTQVDNNLDRDRKGRQWNMRKILCKYGHVLSGYNLHIKQHFNRKPERICRECNRNWAAEKRKGLQCAS